MNNYSIFYYELELIRLSLTCHLTIGSLEKNKGITTRKKLVIQDCNLGSKINVEGSEISIIAIDNRDYISLTDMVRDIENGSALIEKWLRNKNTIEFLGIWEEMYLSLIHI